MNDLTLGSLAERLQRVERENRRLRVGLLAALVLIVAVAAFAVWRPRARSPGKTLEAERFVLRSANGQPRAILGLEHGARVRLTLSGAEGDPGAELEAGPQGAYLSLASLADPAHYHGPRRRWAGARVEATPQGTILSMGYPGRLHSPTVSMAVAEDTSLKFLGPFGGQRAEFGLYRDFRPSIKLYEAAGGPGESRLIYHVP